MTSRDFAGIEDEDSDENELQLVDASKGLLIVPMPSHLAELSARARPMACLFLAMLHMMAFGDKEKSKAEPLGIVGIRRAWKRVACTCFVDSGTVQRRRKRYLDMLVDQNAASFNETGKLIVQRIDFKQVRHARVPTGLLRLPAEIIQPASVLIYSYFSGLYFHDLSKEEGSKGFLFQASPDHQTQTGLGLRHLHEHLRYLVDLGLVSASGCNLEHFTVSPINLESSYKKINTKIALFNKDREAELALSKALDDLSNDPYCCRVIGDQLSEFKSQSDEELLKKFEWKTCESIRLEYKRNKHHKSARNEDKIIVKKKEESDQEFLYRQQRFRRDNEEVISYADQHEPWLTAEAKVIRALLIYRSIKVPVIDYDPETASAKTLGEYIREAQESVP